jgi:hypothetical protein
MVVAIRKSDLLSGTMACSALNWPCAFILVALDTLGVQGIGHAGKVFVTIIPVALTTIVNIILFQIVMTAQAVLAVAIARCVGAVGEHHVTGAAVVYYSNGLFRYHHGKSGIGNSPHGKQHNYNPESPIELLW